MNSKLIHFQMMTGTGTFESYVNVGSGCAATPDGRLSGQPTASDCSPQPFPQVSTVNTFLLDMCDCMPAFSLWKFVNNSGRLRQPQMYYV